MRRPMEVLAEDSLSAAADRKDSDARMKAPSAGDEASAGQRAQAAMACYESYIAGYRAWARTLRRPTS